MSLLLFFFSKNNMKKTFFSIFALFTFSLCNAQLKTQSNYDVDGNGKVTVEDVTSTVNKVLGKASDDRILVDGEGLNVLLLRIDARLKAIEEKLGISTPSTSDTPEPADPYNGHEYVDLGLPSGLKWATCNVGASKPEEYGEYFAWGATKRQDVYDWVHTPYQTQNTTSSSSTRYTKYLGYIEIIEKDNHKDPFAADTDALKTVLDPEDDAAHVNWGGYWRMPTEAEQEELLINCYWEWTTSYNGKSVNGYIIYKAKDSADQGKYSSDYTPIGSYSVSDPHIFLPAAGYRVGSSVDYAGLGGVYWSSSLHDSSWKAYCLSFMKFVDCGDIQRYFGSSVRAVCQQPWNFQTLKGKFIIFKTAHLLSHTYGMGNTNKCYAYQP